MGTWASGQYPTLTHLGNNIGKCSTANGVHNAKLHTHTHSRTSLTVAPRGPDQVMTTVVARSDCKVRTMVVVCVWVLVCINYQHVDVLTNMFGGLRVHVCIGASSTANPPAPRPFFAFAYHICFCICKCEQLWLLPFARVNKLVKTEKEVREHLEKVHRQYGRGNAVYEGTATIMPSPKIVIRIFIFASCIL